MSVHHRTDFGRTPAKGTWLRLFLRMSLRPQGVTESEFHRMAGGENGGTKAYAMVQNLVDQKGWDVRAFPIRKGGKRQGDRVCYKCVGKMRWDGSYRAIGNYAGRIDEKGEDVQKLNPVGKLLALELLPELPALWAKHPDGLTPKMIEAEMDCLPHVAYEAMRWLVALDHAQIIRRPDRSPAYLVPRDWTHGAWDLTDKQQRSMTWLASVANEDGYVLASMRDIARGAGLSQGGLVAHIDALDRKGYLRIIDHGTSANKTLFRVYPAGDAADGGRWSRWASGVSEPYGLGDKVAALQGARSEPAVGAVPEIGAGGQAGGDQEADDVDDHRTLPVTPQR